PRRSNPPRRKPWNSRSRSPLVTAVAAASTPSWRSARSSRSMVAMVCCTATNSTGPPNSRSARTSTSSCSRLTTRASASRYVLTDDFFARCPSCTPDTDSREADAMRNLTFGMNLSLDGYIAAPGDDLGWSLPSDELFQWWSDRVAATGLALYGRKLWETMSSHWPTADQQPGATPAHIEFARRWRDMPKGVFSSTTRAVDWNARLVTGDAVTEITRLKTEAGGPMDVGGATLAAVAMRAGLIDEYAIVTHPVLVGGGTPFFTALDNWVNLNLVETRTFPDGVLLTRYETRR